MDCHHQLSNSCARGSCGFLLYGKRTCTVLLFPRGKDARSEEKDEEERPAFASSIDIKDKHRRREHFVAAKDSGKERFCHARLRRSCYIRLFCKRSISQSLLSRSLSLLPQTENGGDDLWVKNWGMLYDHEEVELSTQISELHTELAAMDDAIAAAQSDVKTRCDSVRKAQRKK